MPITFKIRRFAAAAILLALAWCVPASRAASITNLFNTGVDAFGNPLIGTGVADPHYKLISAPAAYTAVTVNDPGYPIAPNGPWVANSPTSRWIGPDGTSLGAPGNYDYRTAFTVPANAILSSVNVFGLWAVDDVATDILINGSSTAPPSPFYTPLQPFAVTSGFVFGTNTLDFLITNANIGINPTGLRVDRIVGSYQVPEPATASLAGIAIVMSVGAVRRLRSTNKSEEAMS
jgi:hypothetical protein